jgi:hypothetical protein
MLTTQQTLPQCQMRMLNVKSSPPPCIGAFTSPRSHIPYVLNYSIAGQKSCLARTYITPPLMPCDTNLKIYAHFSNACPKYPGYQNCLPKEVQLCPHREQCGRGTMLVLAPLNMLDIVGRQRPYSGPGALCPELPTAHLSRSSLNSHVGNRPIV